MQLGRPVAYALGLSGSPGVLLPILTPLPIGLPTTVSIQFAAVGTDPSTLNWNDPSAVSSAPVVTPRLKIVAGTVSLSGTTASVTAMVENEDGGAVPGLLMRAFDNTGGPAGKLAVSQTLSATVANIAVAPNMNYWLYALGVQPVGSTFAAPFSMGPASRSCLLPVTSPTLTSVAYDGAELAVAWQPASQVSGVASRDAAYWLQIYRGGAIVATYPASSNGARIATTLTPDVSVAAAISLGPLTGPSCAPQPIVASAPSIVGVRLSPDPSIQGNTIVSVAFAPLPGQPAGASIQAVLVQNGSAGTPVTATGTPLQATFSAALTSGGDYFVQAQAVVGGSIALAGPSCTSLPLATAAPKVNVLAYDGERVIVSWTPVPGPAVTGYQLTFTGAMGGSYLTGPASSVALPAYLAPGAALSVVVTPVGPNFTGLTSPLFSSTVPALAPAPIVTECVFDGKSAWINWSPSGGPGLDSYAVKFIGTADSNPPAPTTLVYFTGLAPGLSVTLPGDVPRLWNANVTPLAGNNNGQGSSSVTVVTAVAAITGLSLNANNATVSWSIEGATQALLTQLTGSGGTLRGMLLDGDQMVATASTAVVAATGQLPLALPSGVDPSRLTVATQLVLAGALGPRSGAVHVLAAAPTAVAANYDGQWLAATWNGGGQAGVTGYVVTLTPAAGQAVVITTGPETTLQTACNLALSTTWQISVQPFGANTTGVASAGVAVALPAALSAPVITSVVLDNELLRLAWDAPNLPYLTGYQLAFTGSLVATLVTGAETSLAFSLNASQATNLSLTVTGLSALRNSPTSMAVAVIGVAPVISNVTLSSGNIAVVWSVASPPTGAIYMAELLDGDTVVSTAPATATGATVPVPSGSPARYRVRGFVTVAAAVGPRGGSVAVLATTPVMGPASYDGQWLTMTWNGKGQADVLGYLITLTPADTTKPPVIFMGGPETFLEASCALDLGTTWQATVQPFGANCVGVTSAAAAVTLPPTITAPAFTAVGFDGSSLALNWAAANLPYLTGYQLTLTPGTGGAQHFSTGTETELVVPLTPELAAGATLTITGVSALRATPASAALTLVAAAPFISGVALASGKINVTWTVASPPAGATFTAELLDGETVISTVAGTSSGAEITLPSSAPASRFQVRGLVGSGVVAGPRSGLVAVLAATPTVVSAAYDGQSLALSWNSGGQDGVLGYNVTLTPAAGTAVNFVTGPETTLQLNCNLALGTTWQAAVQPFGANSTGLASAGMAVTLPPALTAPAFTSAVYDGERLTLAWNQSNLPYLTGYQLALTGGVTATVSTGPETTLSLPLTPVQATGTSVTVTGVSALRNSAASTAASLVAASPLVTGVSVTSGSAVVVWSCGTLPAGTTAVAELLDGESVVATSAGTATGATIAIPAPATGTRYAVRGFLLNGVARGPVSGSVAVLATAPAPIFALLSRGLLDVQWKSSPDAGVQGYVVAFGKTGGSTTTLGTGATRLAQPLASLDLAPGTIQISAAGANTASPAASIPISTAWTVASGAYDGANLTVNLTAGTGTAPDSLWLDVLVNGAVAARSVVPSTPLTGLIVPVALPPGTPAAVQITGVGTTAVTPPSAPVALASTPPQLQSAVYDGTTLHVSWTPVTDAGISGYLVSVAGANPTVPPQYVTGAASSSTAIAATIALPFGAAVQVTIQGVTQLSAGQYLAGPVSATFAPSLAGYVRACAAAATNAWPYLYRRGQFAALSGVNTANVVAYLPNPFTSGTPTVPSGTGQLFQLAPAPAGSNLAYALTIDKSAWTFDTHAVRAAWRTAYRMFLVTVEQQNVAPWAIPLLQQIIAAVLPQTFAETLYYRYGLWSDSSVRLLDLKPGLRVHLSSALYQLVTSDVSDARNGFTASGADDFDFSEVITYQGTSTTPSPLLSADAFLSQLFPADRTGSTYPSAGPMDFFQTNASQPYFRLFFPGNNYPASGSIGSQDPTANIALIGAPSWKVLEDVTDFYSNNGAFPPGGAYFVTYFRGRSAITALLDVNLSGAPRWVPVGTTLRQLLATQGLAPYFGGSSGNAVALARPVANVFDQPFGGDAPLHFETVSLAGADFGTFTPLLQSLDLPLLGGDCVTLAAPPAP